MPNKTEKYPSPVDRETPQTCPECYGRGWVDNRCAKPDIENKCGYCNGKGIDAAGKPCYACKGTGLLETRTVDKIQCPRCKGLGRFPIPDEMKTKDFLI